MDSSATGRDVIKRIAQVYEDAGRLPPGSTPDQSLTALAHALQCAQLAEWAGAEPPLVAAALLHDFARLAGGPAADSAADAAAAQAQQQLRAALGDEVAEPIRLQHAAQRYLLATEPAYGATLAEETLAALSRQGPPMGEAEQQRFEDEAFAPQAVLLRRWIDAEKTPGKTTPSLAYYLVLLEEVREQPRAAQRSVVGALDI